jgi:hypothetical protein
MVLFEQNHSLKLQFPDDTARIAYSKKSGAQATERIASPLLRILYFLQ